MKKHLLICITLLTIFFVGNAFAQKEKPNFSGTWNFDQTKSGRSFSGQEMWSAPINCEIKLLIVHNEPELIIRRTSICGESKKSLKTTETVHRYFTDEREEVNTSSRGQIVESKTRWDKDRVVITIYQVNPKNGKKKTSLVYEISLSKDKQKLTERIAENEASLSPSAGFGTMYQRMVYKISK